MATSLINLATNSNLYPAKFITKPKIQNICKAVEPFTRKPNITFNKLTYAHQYKSKVSKHP